jgi:MFS family permease
MASHHPLRALAHRNFRLFFAGQGLSLVGTWVQSLALSWMVPGLVPPDQAPAWLGVVTFAGQIPAFFLSPVAGVLVDRWNRHRLIVLTQTLAMLQAAALAVLTLTGAIDIWSVLALNLFIGLVNVFDMTGRQAFLTEMVADRGDLGNAIALNSSLVNGARLVGPFLAGGLLALTDNPGLCFVINALSYLAVIVALLAMRVAPPRPRAGRRHPWHELREGLAYAFGFAPIRAILLLLALVSAAGMSYAVLLPLIARDQLHGDAVTLAVLTAASALGALLAAGLLAARASVLGLGKWIAAAPVLMGASLAAFSFTDSPWLAAPLMAVIGFAAMLNMAASNTVLQTIVDEDKRGRVMSLYTLAFLGVTPVGGLLAGLLANAAGIPFTLRVGAALCAAGGLAFATQLGRLRQLVRPLYVRLGILPDLGSSGVHPAVWPASGPDFDPSAKT